MKTESVFKQILAIVAVSIVFSGFTFGQYMANAQISNQNVFSDLDGYFRNVINTQKYVGLGACLIKNDHIIWEA